MFKLNKITSLIIMTTTGMIPLSTNASPVSIQGTATSENAVSIGSNNYATAVDGVANGQGSIATGQGFSREDFALKAAENKTALDAVNSKQTDLNNKGNQLDAANTAIGQLQVQINDLTNQQSTIADKIAQKDVLTDKASAITPALDTAKNTFNQAESDLSNLMSNGKNLYLNFTDVLNSLNWSPLNGTDAGRNIVANELKSKIETNFSDFAGRYTDEQYRAIVDGYINRQASYQGSYEDINSEIKKNHSFLNIKNDKLLNVHLFNSALNDNSYIVDYDLEGKVIFNNITYDQLKTNKYYLDGLFIDSSGKLSGAYKGVEKPMSISDYHSTASILVENGNINGIFSNMNVAYAYFVATNEYDTDLNIFTQKDYNTSILVSESVKKSERDNVLNLLNKYTGYDFVFLNPKLNLNVNDFVKNYNNSSFRNYSSLNRVSFNLKGISLESIPLIKIDKNISILSKLKDFTVSNQNLITTEDIAHYKEFYRELLNYKESIDWNFDKSAINLTDYGRNLDKVIAYNDKINTILDLYQSIIDERKKSDADTAKIERETQQLMSLKNDVLDNVNDMSNFIAGIEPTYNKEWADYYLFYGKEEADKLVARVNNELKLYNDKDEIVVATTEKAKELQKAYDDAKADLDKKQAELDAINKQIDDLALTPSEQAVDDVKRAKEQELAVREADKARLEDEIAKGNDELDKLKEELAKTSLKDLGLRSQAYGSNAFASGDDSIAMGTNATVTKVDGIAIGREANVTGAQSIAIGAGNTVTGNKSIAIGVGHTVSGNRSTTIGDPNVISGDDVFVAGNNNSVRSNNVMVMGNNVSVAAGFDGAVVLGANSTVEQANPTASYTIQGKTYAFAGKSPTSTVSVGAENAERQIVNVAAGRISETSTDAINGSQLYAVAAAIEAMKVLNLDEIADQLVQPTVTAGQGVTLDVSNNADGSKNYTISATGGTTIINAGTDIKAGDNVTVTGDATNGFTISANNTQNTVSTSGQGVKITEPQNDNGTTNYQVDAKIGGGLAFDANGNIVNNLSITAGDNVAITGNATAGYTISAQNTQASVSGSDGVKVSESLNANGTKNYNVAVSGVTTTTDDGVTVARSSVATPVAVKGDGKNISTKTNRNGDVVVQLADDVKVNSVTTGNVSMSADGMNAGNQRVTNVASGEISPVSRDAVNGSQLYATNQAVANNTQNINRLDNKIDKVDKRANRGIAVAGAMGMLPQPHLSGKSMVSAAVSNYRGEQALAVGYSRLSDNSKHIIKLSSASNLSGKKDVMVGASYGYQW